MISFHSSAGLFGRHQSTFSRWRGVIGCVSCSSINSLRRIVSVRPSGFLRWRGVIGCVSCCSINSLGRIVSVRLSGFLDRPSLLFLRRELFAPSSLWNTIGIRNVKFSQSNTLLRPSGSNHLKRIVVEASSSSMSMVTLRRKKLK